jgi:hypothetical protein
LNGGKWISQNEKELSAMYTRFHFQRI